MNGDARCVKTKQLASRLSLFEEFSRRLTGGISVLRVANFA
jgi:hypothetical protein